MSEKERKKIDLEKAKELLTESPFVHVFQENGDLMGYYWDKKRVEEFLEANGPELAGDNARKLRHGLCSFNGKEWYYFETKKPPEVKNG